MFKFFESIASAFTILVDFIINLVQMLVMVVINVGKGIAWLFTCLTYLPPWLVAFVAVPISLAVIFQILNKGS
nr:MAG TPA: hypothetical protein [Inoviridae sp.]